MSDDTTERYYAEMEAFRNESVDSYFGARPGKNTANNREIFRAGFERAFSMLWARALAVEAATADTEVKS
jgi:hypothetical protein